MYDLDQIINGIKMYLERELINRCTGWEKWVVGAGVSMYLENGVDIFNDLKENPFVKKMNIINTENEIDVDRLYNAILDEARKSAITFRAPLVGSITLKADDVEKIYTYIKEFKK